MPKKQIMIYTPQKSPKEAFITISLIVFFGIVGGIVTKILAPILNLSKGIYVLFPLIALFFWIQYTLVLAYIQFQNNSKHNFKSITDFLLHPVFRFFIFLLLAFYGIYHVFLGEIIISYLVLFVWWIFSLNFYVYYKNGKK
jgi:hypothetical protein